MDDMIKCITLLICLAAALTGCAPRASQGSFDSPDPAAKLYAIHRAGTYQDTAAVKDLVEQLSSDDLAVRMIAINALDRIIGHRLGYNPYAPLIERQTAVDRWVQFARRGYVSSERL